MDENGLPEIANPHITMDYLRSNYFSTFPENFELSVPSFSNARMGKESEYFTKDQNDFIKKMETKMDLVESSTELREVIIQLREEAIHHIKMTDEQKLGMLTLVELTNSLHENLISGGLNQIAGALTDDKYSKNGRRGISSIAHLNFNTYNADDDDGSCGGESASSNDGGCSVN